MAPPLKKEELSLYFQEMQDWVYDSINNTAKRAPSTDGILMMGCVVYGDKYTDLFLKYCIPSLLTEGNDIPSRLVIHTDRASIPKIKAGVAPLNKRGMIIEIHTIPILIISQIKDHPANKYWLLGACHNIQMQMAALLGFSYHMLMPDHVYSRNYFKNLLRLSKDYDAIVQGALSAEAEQVELDNNGTLSLDASELVAKAVSNMHSAFKPYVMNGRDYKKDCPLHSFLIFIGERVHIVCPHMSLAYLSNDILKRCPLRLFNTIDTQLPFFIPEDARVKNPSTDDDMAYIEISDRTKDNYQTLYNDLLGFAVRFWILTYCETGFLRFLNMETILGLPDGYQAPFEPMAEQEIQAIKTEIKDYVASMYEHIKPELEECYHKDPLPQRA